MGEILGKRVCAGLEVGDAKEAVSGMKPRCPFASEDMW